MMMPDQQEQHAGTAHPRTAVNPATGALNLHPNLARIAVAYQELTQSYAAGQVDATQAAVRARELIARDDEGVQWTINPRDGGWLRCTRDGQWVPGDPPHSGVATLAAWELSGNGVPDAAVRYVQAAHPADSTGLKGSTYRKARQMSRLENVQRPRWLYPVIVTAVLLGALFAALALADDGHAVPTTPEATIPAALNAYQQAV